jgi:hypothetical protein
MDDQIFRWDEAMDDKLKFDNVLTLTEVCKLFFHYTKHRPVESGILRELNDDQRKAHDIIESTIFGSEY